MNAALTYTDRVRGCLLGGAVGDALGAGIEFETIDQIRHEHGPAGVTSYVQAYGGSGKITDDTQLTVINSQGICRALRQATSVDREVYQLSRDWAYWQQMRQPPPDSNQWLLEHPVLGERRAPGNACLSGLTAGRMATLDHRVNPNSKGSGTTMRSAPFGLVLGWTPVECFEQAVICAVQSHGHDTALVAAGALAMIVRHLLDGLALREATEGTVDWIEGHCDLDAEEAIEKVNEALAASLVDEPTIDSVEHFGSYWPPHVEPGYGWTADEALGIGLFAALLCEGDVRQGLLLAVNHSGDSDSTGSVCGNLLGAAYGDRALPEEWIEGNEVRNLILSEAEQLSAAALG